MNYLSEAHFVLDAYFIYAAFTCEGYIKVGISRVPFERIAQVHAGSPFAIEAAMWSWVGSHHHAKRIESRLKKLWAVRNSRGEWYRFDYEGADEKRAFFDTINVVFEARVGTAPEWTKHSHDDIRAMVNQTIRKNLSGYLR